MKRENLFEVKTSVRLVVQHRGQWLRWKILLKLVEKPKIAKGHHYSSTFLHDDDDFSPLQPGRSGRVTHASVIG